MSKKGGSHLTAEQLRYLFASGILGHAKGRGSKRGGVTYNKSRADAIRKLSGKGSPSSTYRQKDNAHIGPNSSKAFANRASHGNTGGYGSNRLTIGEKASGPRSTRGAKVDHSATRADRLARALDKRREVLSDAETAAFKGRAARAGSRSDRLNAKAAQAHADLQRHTATANAYNRAGQPINANSQSAKERRRLAQAQAQATKSWQAADRRDALTAEAEHARLAPYRALREKVRGIRNTASVKQIKVGDTVDFNGRPAKVLKARKNDLVVDFGDGRGSFTISRRNFKGI